MDVDPRSLSSLVASLNDQIAETELKIAALTSSAQRLVPTEVYEELIKEKPPAGEVPDEELIISELQKARIELVSSLSQQDFITSKLQGMIADSQSLVSTVVDHFEARESVVAAEEEAFANRCTHYRDSIENVTLKDLTENVKLSSTALKRLQADSLRILQSIDSKHDKSSAIESKEDLSKVINALNDLFGEMSKV